MNIFIPTPLHPYFEGKDAVEVDAGTSGEALELLTQAHSGLRKHLFTDEGKLRGFVHLYFNDEDVRYLPQKEQTSVTSDDTLSIIPSTPEVARSSDCAFCIALSLLMKIYASMICRNLF